MTTAGLIRSEDTGGIRVIELSAGATNLMTAPMRQALHEALQAALGDAAVTGIVLLSDGLHFSGGRDVGELAVPEVAPRMRDITLSIDTASKPVVVGLTGFAYGTGAEIAVAAHRRIGSGAAAIGFPDVSLGLTPAAGGTQFLPRLVGGALSLKMLLNGRPVAAEEGAEAGLFDQVIGSGVRGAAIAAAREMTAPDPVSKRRDKLRDGTTFLQAVSAAKGAVTGSFVRERLVTLIEAALIVPFPAALHMEETSFEESRQHPQSLALRHVFGAERRISEVLLAREAGGRRTLTDAGRAIIEALFAAQDRAIVAMVSRGTPETTIDSAMIGLGFAQGPFAGPGGDVGPDVATAQQKLISAVMAEGARLVDGQAADAAGDIDALAVHGMGFVRHRGGPMFIAQHMGLASLERRMRDWTKDDPVWDVPDLLLEAIKAKGRFDPPD